MKKIDPDKVYGGVPETFSRRVEYALRRCEKEETKPMKRKSIVALIVTVLMLALTTTAVAATLSRTIEFFNLHYGSRYNQELEEGAYVPGGHYAQLNDAGFTIDDAIISRHVTEWSSDDPNAGDEAVRSIDTLAFWVTGTISVAEDENIVLLASDDYTVNDPAGYALYYGSMYPSAPEGAPTYADIAKEKGAVIRQVNCIPNGILDENGELYLSTPGRCLIPQPDGTVQFSVEIASETVVPERDSYQLSLWLTTEDLDLDGNPIEGTRRSQDWIVTLTPEKPE